MHQPCDGIKFADNSHGLVQVMDVSGDCGCTGIMASGTMMMTTAIELVLSKADMLLDGRGAMDFSTGMKVLDDSFASKYTMFYDGVASFSVETTDDEIRVTQVFNAVYTGRMRVLSRTSWPYSRQRISWTRWGTRQTATPGSFTSAAALRTSTVVQACSPTPATSHRRISSSDARELHRRRCIMIKHGV